MLHVDGIFMNGSVPSPETANITCPRPSDPKSSMNYAATLPMESQAEGDSTHDATKGKGKRKRTCSHCHLEGHTKTKKGKVTCPALLQN